MLGGETSSSRKRLFILQLNSKLYSTCQFPGGVGTPVGHIVPCDGGGVGGLLLRKILKAVVVNREQLQNTRPFYLTCVSALLRARI